MLCRRLDARINVKLVVIVVSILAVLGVGAFVARHVRRKVLAERDLAAGLAAYEQQDWPTACKHFREYLGRRREDTEILRKYADCLMAIEPVEAQNLGKATGAYRELLNLTPEDAEVYRKLARLYTHTRNFAELVYVARRRLERANQDVEAPIWLAKGLMGQRHEDEARDVLEELADRLAEAAARPREYVEACCLLSALTREQEGEKASAEALEWLDLAVEYGPTSARALVNRARFYRTRAPFGGRTKEAMLRSARADLRRAEGAKIDDPRFALLLSEEWMHHGKLDDSQRWLVSVQDVAPARLKKYFLNPGDWTVAHFLQAAELAIRRDQAEKAAALADKTLEQIKGRRQRLAILPQAVRAYLVAGRIAAARKHLEEYLDLRKVLQIKEGGLRETTVLRALVAGAEGRPEEVIRLLRPFAARGDAEAVVLRLLGKAYSRTGQRERSLEALRAYLKHNPQDANVWMLLAREHLRLRQWSQASEAAGKAESLAEGKLDAKLLGIEAGIHAAAEKPASERKGPLDALLRRVADLRKAHPDEARIRALQAQVELAQGRPEAAETHLRRGIEQCSATLGLELQLASLLISRGLRDKALAICTVACDRHAKSVRPWRALSRLHQTDGDLAKARAVLRRGIEAVDQADRPALARDLAVLDFQAGDRQAGLKRLRDLAAQDPADVRTRSLLLNLPETIEDTKLAEKLLEEIRHVRGANSQLWRRHRARMWLARDDWRSRRDEILQTLEKWMTEDPKWSFPALMLAGLQQRLGRAKEAEAVCRRALALNPAAVDVAELLIRLLQRQNRPREAEKVLAALDVPTRDVTPLRLRMGVSDGALDRPIEELTFRAAGNPRDVTARILLAGLIYRRTRNAKRALRYLDEAAAVQPDSIAVAATRAAILKAEGGAAQALKILDREVEKTGSFAAYLIRARHLESVGRHGLAEQDYRHLTTLEPRARGYQLLARFYENRRRLNDAIAALEKGVAAFQDDTALRSQLIQVLLRRRAQGDLQRADEILADLEKRLGETPDLLWTRATLARARGGEHSTRKARAALERLLELEPSHAAACLALIEIARQSRDYRQARALAVRGLEANPNDAALLVAHGRIEQALGNSEAASALARRVVKQNAGNVHALEILVTIAVQSKKAEALAEALDLVRAGMRARPADPRLPLMAASVHEALGKPEEAVAELVAYTRTPPGRRSIAVLIALARMHRDRKQADAWDGWIRRAEEIDPRHPVVLTERLRWHAARKEFGEIASRMSAYRQGDAARPSVMIAAASLLADSGDKAHHQEAIKLCERAVALASDPAEPRLALAVLLFRTGDAARAEAAYREILKSDPDHQQALNGLAWVLATARKDYSAALPLVDKAVKLKPDDSHALDTRGVILSNLPGRLADARKDFEKCVELIAADSPRRAKALLQLGRVCAKLNDTATAREHLENAREIDAKRRTLTPEQRKELADLLGKLPPAT